MNEAVFIGLKGNGMGKKTNRKKNRKEERANAAIGRLYVLGDEIRGMGHLLQNQRPDEFVALDFPAPYTGVGSILDSLGRKVRKSIVAIEEHLLDLHSSSDRRDI